MKYKMDRLTKEDVKNILKKIKDKELSLKLRIHFDEILDETYAPPRLTREDRYSESEGSAEEEEGYDVYVDSHGFQSLF